MLMLGVWPPATDRARFLSLAFSRSSVMLAMDQRRRATKYLAKDLHDMLSLQSHHSTPALFTTRCENEQSVNSNAPKISRYFGQKNGPRDQNRTGYLSLDRTVCKVHDTPHGGVGGSGGIRTPITDGFKPRRCTNSLQILGGPGRSRTFNLRGLKPPPLPIGLQDLCNNL